MSAAVLAAAALLRVPDPGARSAPPSRARDLPANDRETRIAPGRFYDPTPSVTSRISAETLDRTLSATRPGTQDLVLDRMLTIWTSIDPPAAARYAELQTAPFLRDVALRAVAQRWARIDGDAAAQWAASLADDNERDQVMQHVALAIAASDPRRALELLDPRQDGLADAARAGAITRWATVDFPAAQAWVEAQPPGPKRNAIVLRLAFLRAQDDPPAAVGLADQLLDADAPRQDAYASIIGPWMRSDPEAARAWIASADTRSRIRLDAEIAISGRESRSD